MKVQIRPSFADLTAPLLPPDILGGFEALADGRCSVSELTGAVLEACRDDPNTTDAVLLLLEGYSSCGEFERFDLGPLKRALERSGEIQEPTSDIEPGPLDGEPLRDSAAAPQASLSAVDEPAGHLADIPESEEVDGTFTHGFMELVDQYADLPAVAAVDKPRVLRERYILEAVIGRGGVGTVYRALDLNRAGLPPGHRHVAVKILGENAVRRAEAVDSLRCEYHQAQLLSHPGIVNVFDFDHDGDTHFVTMELIDGESVGESMRRLFPNKLPLDAAMRILRELGDAIVYAHDRGVLHLDLKPDNVMIDAEGRVRVLDFGIARTRLPEPGMPPIRSAPPAATPAYASCERLVQERPDARDDVFSFSCIAYELLAGKHPFDRSSALQARKDGRKAQRIRDLSRRQWVTLESGLAWAREDRPANMRALLLGLGLQSSASAGTSAGRVTWHRAAAGALIALGTAALLSWAAMRDRIQDGGERRMVAAGESAAVSAAVEVSPSRVDRPAVQPVAAASAPSRNEESETPVAAKRVFDEPPRDTPRSTPEFFAATPVSAQVVAEPSRGSLAPRAVTAAGEVPAAAPKPVSQPMDVLGFSRHSFSVSEADSVVHVNVRRLGGATGEVKFQWYTVDDSARAGQDYVYGFGEVQMPPGQTTATFEVPIVTDTIREDPELLQVIIGSSSGAQVGAAGRVPVIIVDDD